MSAAVPPLPPEPGDNSLKPYLLRAIYEWAVDHRMTPQVLVDAGSDGVAVPPERVKDGRIALNIDPQAVTGLEMGNEVLAFSARFGGKAFPVRVPVAAVIAIYCREDGRGIAFHTGDEMQPKPVAGRHAKSPAPTPTPKPKGKVKQSEVKPRRPAAPPHLKLVK